MTGLSGNVRYNGLWIDHEFDKTKAPEPEKDNYLTIEVDEKILTVKSFLSHGTSIDEISLTK